MARLSTHAAAAAVTALGTVLAGTACAEPLGFAPQQQQVFQQVMPERDIYPPTDETRTMPARLRRQIVSYPTREAPGTIVIDTPATRLYYVLGGGKAIAYGIGVGREGFTWSGVQTISRKSEWPDWIPPQEMLQRQPYLPRFMAGGPANPLGARAMYLGGTIYRIHGTNAPETIGTHVSSGCIRMVNEDVIDLYNRVSTGTKVVVLPDRPRVAALPSGAERREEPARPLHSAVAKPVTVAFVEPHARETFASAGSIRPFGLY
ncbi:MAG: L,D-transpeptidase [Xanthobacteraceae bacterium]|nr:L,D-transpeptidase [Xanthobacteraceae bacterium]